MRARSEANLASVARWVAATPWVDFLARESSTRSCTSICLRIADPWFLALESQRRSGVVKQIVALLEAEGVAYDVGSYRDAPPGLRIWGGATVENEDVEAVLPWFDWAFLETKGAGR